MIVDIDGLWWPLIPMVFRIWANPGLFFAYFRPFLIPITITVSITTMETEKSVDGMLGI